MSASIPLRIAKTSDLPELIALWQTVFGDDEGFIRAFYEASGIDRTIVALDNGRVIGMINCPAIELWIKSERYRGAYIYALAVDARYRGAGIGSALLKATESGDYLAEVPQFLLLIPAEASLFDYYAKKGYDRAAFAPKMTDIAPKQALQAELAHDSEALYRRYLASCEVEAEDGALFVKTQPIFALSMGGTLCYPLEDGYIAMGKSRKPIEIRPATPDLTNPKALWKALVDISTDISPIISRFMED